MTPRIGFLGDVFSVYEKTGMYKYAEGVLQGLLENKTELRLFLASSEVSPEFKKIDTIIADYCNVGRVLNDTSFAQNLPFFARNLKLSSDLNKLVDVVYSPVCRIPDISYLACLRIPMITTLHDVHALVTKSPFSYKFKYIFRYASPKIMIAAKKFFLAVPTLYVKNHVVEYLHIPPKKIEVIPATVEAPPWAFNLAERKARDMVKEVIGVDDYILFIARQFELPMLLSAIKVLNTVFHFNIPLVIAGRGIDKITSQELANKLGLRESVIVLGAISEPFKWILF